MKKLNINWLDLELAFERMMGEMSFMDETSNYFDKLSGQVVVFDEWVREVIHAIMDELNEVVADDALCTDEDVFVTPSYAELGESEKARILAAFHFECEGCSDRFAHIPQFESHQAFEWMEDFVETVEDEELRERLTVALERPKPFRNFRNVLDDDRRLQRKWRRFESSLQREAIIEWLKGIGIEPLNPTDATYDPPPLPELRKIMFAEVRRFVRFARDLPGVQRIALIGSLASDKEFPKGIDMLVTITDDCDLDKLAIWSRQLAGHMLAHGAGANVFLASATDDYLGRTCPWKNCGPGIRKSCDARNCGARRFLHDDFSAIRLSKRVIQHPPVRLWPEIGATPDSPPDVMEELLEPLSQDPHR